MYCIQCGVKLADTEKVCPLCGTVPYHPDIPHVDVPPLYPENRYPAVTRISRLGIMMIVTVLFVLPALITLLVDLRIAGTVTWSGYVISALLLTYICVCLPQWFKHPNPVIFVPIAFTAAGVFLLYVNHVTDGNWFLSFAFPAVGAFGAIVTAVVTLLRYVRRGHLYIFGGATLAVGAVIPLLEFLMNRTFSLRFVAWSVYPFTALVLLGGLLLFFAICRPARESMERKFFI